MARANLFVRAAVLVCFTVVLVAATARFLQKPEAYVKNQEFFEADENYDVLFFGSSHAVMGILPMEIWNEYGITSYNLSNGGQRLAEDYWVLKEALERQNPTLVVIDTYTTCLNEKYDETVIGSLHETFDAMPFSRTKIDAVYDIFPEENRMEFLFPFSIYHNRWESISEGDFRRAVSYQKGSYENGALASPGMKPMEPVDFCLEYTGEIENTINTAYLRKCIELCQEQEIPVLLLMTPYNEPSFAQSATNTAYMLAKEYGVPFLNGLEQDVVNVACDFRDEEHLNSSGARKWSSFVGGYIAEHYGIEDKRDDATFGQWWADYGNYTNWKLSQADNAWGVYSFMILLQDPGFSYCIYIEGGSQAFVDDQFWSIMENAGYVNRPTDDTQGYFCMIDNLDGTITEVSGSLDQSGASEEIMAFMRTSEEEDIHFLILDKQNGMVLKEFSFTFEKA